MASVAPRRRALRSPFVITVATVATALGAGCGGRAVVDSQGGTDPKPSTVQPPKGEPGLGSFDCEILPSVGSPCTAGSQCMPLQRCVDDRLVFDGVECVGGTWLSTTHYGGECRSPCPSEKPPIAGACGPLYKKCTYHTGCPALPPGTDDVVECTDGTWRPLGSYVVACPAAQPVAGESCADCAGHYPDSCGYGDCMGEPQTMVSCDKGTGTWKFQIWTCNPPAVDAGPVTVDGAASDGAK